MTTTSLAQLDQQGHAAGLEVAYLSRQPIYRKQLTVYGYELLYRSGKENSANFVDGDQATAQVIQNAIEFGLDKIIGRDELAFVNLTRNFILEDYCYSLPEDRVVLEVLENISAEKDIVAKLRELGKRGYQIALDDFIYDETLRPLVELADIIKVDVMAIGVERLEEEIAPYKDFDVRLLAEKIETQEEFEFCKELGFVYFQGYFFCKPKLMEGTQIPANRLSTTRLVAQLQDPNITPDELEGTIRQDVALSYKLLRYVNSVSCAVGRQVDSIGHAAMLIGTERIRNWASIIMLASMGDKPRELMLTAIIRAKMCEDLAAKVGIPVPQRLFTVGLLSVIDAMLDSTMEDVLERLPLSEEVASALLTHEDTLGRVLDFTISYEQDSWDHLSELAATLNIDMPTAQEAYLNALDWTTQITTELNV